MSCNENIMKRHVSKINQSNGYSSEDSKNFNPAIDLDLSQSFSDNGDETYSIIDGETDEERLDQNLTSESTLNAYEEWKIKKIHEEKKRAELKKKLEQEKLLKEEEIELKKKIKSMENEKKLNEWLEAKRSQKLSEAQKKKEEKQKEMIRKDQIKEKAEEKFNQWLKKKSEEEKEKKIKQMQEDQKLLQKELEKLKIKKKSELEYQKWYETTKNRPKLGHYDYTKRAITYDNYYDYSTSPEPTYLNPRPWCNIVPTSAALNTTKRATPDQDNNTNNKQFKSNIFRPKSCQVCK